jgi:poly(A) polymerase
MSWQVGAGGSDGATPSQYGLTKVISYKGPTAADTAASATLERVLHERNLYETEEEIACRQAAVATLIELVQSWMREEGLALGVLDPASDASWALQPGMVCMFGSFRLGVHGPGADMDTLVVGPHYITRQMFFEKFTKRLEERSDIVTDLSARTEAYVPLITMKLQGIEFDLLYAQMSATLGFGRADAGEKGALLFNIYDDMCLRGLDPKSVLSLNGARVTDMIRMLMPPESEDAFCTALIFIRLWAKKRGVYSNVHGYLGGISWALLVAQVCQLYPHAAPATLIEKFFALFQQWRWPYPIMLNEVKQVPELKLPVWDPKANFKVC